MKLSEHQRAFTRDIGHLIAFAYQNDFELTFNEALRTPDQQWLYFTGHQIQGGKLVGGPRRSWTTDSYHLKKLAVDFNLFIAGVYQGTSEAHRPLGDFWESLNEYNRWGGRFQDGNHYERHL